jgi:hypothetical protein
MQKQQRAEALNGIWCLKSNSRGTTHSVLKVMWKNLIVLVVTIIRSVHRGN